MALTVAVSISEALHEQTDWREADGEINSIIASAPENHKPFYREVAANDILFWFQDNPPSDPEALNVVAKHTTTLLEANSTSAELILSSLRSLDGHWTESEIQNAAAKAASNGEAHVLKNCATCDGNIMVAAGIEDTRDVNERLRAKARAVSALRDLSE